MWKCVTLLSVVLAMNMNTIGISGQTNKEEICELSSLEKSLITIFRNINKTIIGYCQCPFAENQWKLAFRGTAGIRKSVLDAYQYGLGIPNDVEIGCNQVGRPLPCFNHYRNNNIVGNWSGISDVLLAIYKNDVMVKRVIFDGSNSNYMNWFDKARIKDSSWSDSKSRSANVFSIRGDHDNGNRRTFYMNSVYSSCSGDFGWFVAIDNEDGACKWERISAFPVFKYSSSPVHLNWNDGYVYTADYIAVFVRYFNLP